MVFCTSRQQSVDGRVIDDVVVGDAATFYLREAHIQLIDNYYTASEALDEFDHEVCGVPLTHEQQEILSCAKFSPSPLRHRENEVFFLSRNVFL